MKSFTFQGPANILFEAGAVRKIADLVSQYGAGRVLLVTDKGVRAAGLTKDAEAGMAAAGMSVTVFEDVVADPPSHVIESAAALCRDKQIELVVSIGGGSALDTAKLVAYLAKSPEQLDDIYGVGLAKGSRLPLLLAPTTAGTGSEVTPIAIVTTPTTEKKGVVSPRLIPDWAVLDPELTLGLPRACDGGDRHRCDGSCDRGLYQQGEEKPDVRSTGARQALALLSANIRRVARMAGISRPRVTNAAGIDVGRDGFRQCACRRSPCAGLSDRSDLPCTARSFQCARAAACDRFNLPAAEVLYAELAEIVKPGLRGTSQRDRARAFIDEMISIGQDCAVPASLSAVGIGQDDLKKLAEDAMKQTRLLVNNPRSLTFEDAYAIYSAAYDDSSNRSVRAANE